MKKIMAAVAIAAALALTGCSSPAPTVGAGKAADAAVKETAVADRSAALGETVTYDGGIAVTVASAGYLAAGQYASGAIEGQEAVFELTVKNGSEKELNAALMSLPKVTYGDKNAKAASVIDTANGIGMDMLSTILPGETATVKFAAAVPAAEAGVVRVEVSGPNMITDKAAIFKGAIK